MAKKKGTKTNVIDAGRAESPAEPIDPEIQQEFNEAQGLAGAGPSQLGRRLREHHSRTPDLSAGDVDADWDRADIGEETVGGDNPTPDQDIVDKVGEALGVDYQDNEPLRSVDKIADRDRKRWDLDPASSEDYHERKKR
jgi:hypothetical protein